MANEQALWSRIDSFVSTESDDGAVVLSLEHGRYFSFNNTGSVIWNLLEKPRFPAEIAQALAAEFDVPLAECVSEVDRFLASLQEENLARQVRPPAAT